MLNKERNSKLAKLEWFSKIIERAMYMKRKLTPEKVINHEDFDDFVTGFIDSAKFSSEGKLEIELSVSDIELLKRKLKIPPEDNLSLALIIKSLSERISDNCPGGRCGGTVTQKLQS